MFKLALTLFTITFSVTAQLSLSPVAESFIGVPYDANGPLGEGENGRFDQDPLYRFDAFDCTTFIETVMALTKSDNEQDFKEILNLIRYKDGQVDYLKRNHIISLDWIPNNLSAGHIRPAMEEFSSKFKARARGTFDMGGWISFHNVERLKLPGLSNEEKEIRLKELKAHASSFSKNKVELDYLIIDKLLKNWETFKDQTYGDYILNIVRPNWKLSHLIGTNLHISHQGVLSKQNEELYFIHASSSGKVMKVQLKKYLAKYFGHKTVKGINLLRAAK